MKRKILNGRDLSLPFWEKASEIVALARSGRGIVVLPTGTGKTTQTPQALYEAGFETIFVSVPKRVLAIELAARVADEMGVPLGGLVGYEIRGERKLSKGTKILFMTEGMLRVKIRNNPTLEGVSVILFDEFHERSLLSDFNVALVERAQNEGSKVAFLLMSATADASVLSSHFNCGVVDGTGLTTVYPIAERYVGEGRNIFESAAKQAQDMVKRYGNRNGLVFMPGKAEVDQTVEAIKRFGMNGLTVLPLHGDLDGEERHAPFTQREGVTITVATDIVETGATLPNVGWVVDSGLAKEIGYDPIADTSSLGLVEIAKDRLTQRRGRCGRVCTGEYVGLFWEDNKTQRPTKTKAEILRKPLREVVLTIKALGLSREGKSLRLIDYPEKANWKSAKSQLQMLGLVDRTPEARITELGKRAVELGCDPRDAAMLFKAADIGCLKEMAISIAAHDARLLFTPKGEKEREAALKQHREFKTSQKCDAWTAVEVVRSAENRGQEPLGKWCRSHYVSYRALQEVWNTGRQLLSKMAYFGFVPSGTGTEESLRKAVAAGIPDKIFSYSEYTGRYSEVGGTGAKGVLLGRESVIKPSTDHNLAVWGMIEISTKRGSLKLITSAVVEI